MDVDRTANLRHHRASLLQTQKAEKRDSIICPVIFLFLKHPLIGGVLPNMRSPFSGENAVIWCAGIEVG